MTQALNINQIKSNQNYQFVKPSSESSSDDLSSENPSPESDCYFLAIDNQQDPSLQGESQQEKHSQLSVFSDEAIEQQSAALIQLLSHSEHSIIVRLEDSGRGKHWLLQAHYDALIGLKDGLLASSFDYFYWPEQVNEPPKLLVFDMDSTFIQIEVIDELAKRHHVGDKVIDITEAAMRGELDFSESLIARVKCLDGLSEEAITDLADNLPLSEGIKDLVLAAAKNDTKIAIVSGGFTPFVARAKQELGLYQVRANDLEVKAGQLTGQLVNENNIIDAQAKADFLHELCEQLSISAKQVMAIGDGANDLVMMDAAGFNLAYRAKPKVELQAQGRMKVTNFNQLGDLFSWS